MQSLARVILLTKVERVDSSRGFNFVVRLSVTLMKKSLKCSAFVRSSVNSLIFAKGASRLYLLRQLKRAKGDPAQLLCFYTTCIRPVSEYACQVFHNGLPEYLSDELEKIQRRALRIIFSDLG